METRQYLPTRDAIAYAQCGSPSAFRRWAAKWRLRPVRRGKWLRHLIDHAMQCEERVAATLGRRGRRKAS